MIVKIPLKINIGAYQYDIKYMKGLAKHASSTGQCYTSDGAIWIDPGELKQTKDVTVLHEMLHCVSDVERLKLSDEDIDRIAHCLTRVLRNDFGIEFDWCDVSEVKE